LVGILLSILAIASAAAEGLSFREGAVCDMLKWLLFKSSAVLLSLLASLLVEVLFLSNVLLIIVRSGFPCTMSEKLISSSSL
jgi:hypothetical protein